MLNWAIRGGEETVAGGSGTLRGAGEPVNAPADSRAPLSYARSRVRLHPTLLLAIAAVAALGAGAAPLAAASPAVARARYTATVRDMSDAGADRVVDEESLVGDGIAADAREFLQASRVRRAPGQPLTERR